MAKQNNKPAPLTREQKEQQVLRFFAQKRESYFQGILFNILQNPGLVDLDNIKDAVDASLEAADYAVEKLFPIPENTDEKNDAE